MKPHLFREASLKEENGKQKLFWHWCTDTNAEADFNKSVFDIESLFDLYDYEKIEGTDYYFIYRKCGLSDLYIQDPEEVKKCIADILDGNLDNVENPNDSTLGTPENVEHDVFWDVNNNIVIAKGEEALRVVSTDIFMSGFERLGIKRSPEVDAEYISRSSYIPIIAKIYKLDTTKDAAELRRLLKVM